MGAVANLAPELFLAIIADVPFVDVLNTMIDKYLPLTPPEWPEWGNPLADKSGGVLYIGREQFCQQWHGDVFLMKRLFNAPEASQEFGFRWFIPEILKQKTAFRDIAIAAIAMHFLGLASPMFFLNFILLL